MHFDGLGWIIGSEKMDMGPLSNFGPSQFQMVIFTPSPSQLRAPSTDFHVTRNITTSRTEPARG